MSSFNGPAAANVRIMGRVMFDYAPTAANQLALRKGSMINIIQKGESGGWSKGIDDQGKFVNFLSRKLTLFFSIKKTHDDNENAHFSPRR